ncbi:MAG: patatin-like phospholipase family protein [Frankia sp.]
MCCSGGGLRSAAFNPGAFQALTDSKVLDQVDLVSAASGGSYIAASHAFVSSSVRSGVPA